MDVSYIDINHQSGEDEYGCLTHSYQPSALREGIVPLWVSAAGRRGWLVIKPKLPVVLIPYLVVIFQAITYPQLLLQHFKSQKMSLQNRHSSILRILENRVAKPMLQLPQIHFISQKIV